MPFSVSTDKREVRHCTQEGLLSLRLGNKRYDRTRAGAKMPLGTIGATCMMHAWFRYGTSACMRHAHTNKSYRYVQWTCTYTGLVATNSDSGVWGPGFPEFPDGVLSKRHQPNMRLQPEGEAVAQLHRVGAATKPPPLPSA